MKRAWAESHAIIERLYDKPGKPPRWETTNLHSPTLLESDADDWIVQRKQLGQYRMISVWHQTIVKKGNQISFNANFQPARSLEFFRACDAATRPVGGIWRRLDWQPTKPGFTGKPARWDDLAEAISFLKTRALAGTYRIITIRRMLRAEQAKDRIKIVKKHASGSKVV
ncbi:MAG TPA: hypothetical protein VHS31_10900 [Tepidisphaeraceae bacterium]|nr:hypothetical protein [Tepidisphaeraceae bacterium]